MFIYIIEGLAIDLLTIFFKTTIWMVQGELTHFPFQEGGAGLDPTIDMGEFTVPLFPLHVFQPPQTIPMRHRSLDELACLFYFFLKKTYITS